MKQRIVRYAVFAAMLLVSTVAFAQYTVSYSGGYCEVTHGSPSQAYTVQTNGFYGSGGDGMTVDCSGTITATFTWTGSGPPPLAAVVTQQCGASGWAEIGDASADDGLGDSETVIDTSPPPEEDAWSGSTASGAYVHYSIVTNPGTTFTVTCSPSASSDGVTGDSGVSYAAGATALDLVFTDGNGTGNNASRNYFVGQNVQAQVQFNSGYTASGATWTISGCAPFASYTMTSSSSTYTGLSSPITGTSFSGYFAQTGAASLECVGTLNFPAGALPASAAFDLTRGATLLGPIFTGISAPTGDMGGFPITSPTALGCYDLTFWDTDLSPPASYTVGMYISAGLTGPSGGQFEFVQLTNVARTRSGFGTTQYLRLETSMSPPTWVTSGLDTSLPYEGAWGSTGVVHYSPDDPSQTFEPPTTSWTTYTVSGESFQTYLMFLPPGTGSMWIPFESWAWSWTCSGTYSSSTSMWTAPVTAMNGTTPTPWPGFPIWSVCISGATLAWHS